MLERQRSAFAVIDTAIAEAFDAWDSDNESRCGKLLASLSGVTRGYRPMIDEARAAFVVDGLSVVPTGDARNQCDGCAQRLPVREGVHYRDGRPWIGCTAARYAPAGDAPADDEPPMREAERMYRDLLAKKEQWFRDCAPHDVATSEKIPDAQLIDVLGDLRHFLPSACHWAVNVAIDRLTAARADREDAERWNDVERLGIRIQPDGLGGWLTRVPGTVGMREGLLRFGAHRLRDAVDDARAARRSQGGEPSV